MLFSIDGYKHKNIQFSNVFSMDDCVDMSRLNTMRDNWKAGGGVPYIQPWKFLNSGSPKLITMRLRLRNHRR